MMVYFKDRYISDQSIVYIKPTMKDGKIGIQLYYDTFKTSDILEEFFSHSNDRDDRLRMLLTELKSEFHAYPRD